MTPAPPEPEKIEGPEGGDEPTDEPDKGPAEGEGEQENEPDEAKAAPTPTDKPTPSKGTPTGRATSPRKRGGQPLPEPDEGLQPCPLCGGEGQVPAELKHAPDAEACPVCAGLGMVETGSLVPSEAAIPCTACHGLGYTTPHTVPAVAPIPPLGPDDAATPPGEAPPGVPLVFEPLPVPVPADAAATVAS